MAFVHEQLDQETQSKLRVELKKHQTILGLISYRLVDQESDVVFYSLGGQGERPRVQGAPPNHYLLIWKGHPVAFEAYEHETFTTTSVNGDIEIDRMSLPRALEPDFLQLQQIIKEAFEADCLFAWKRQPSVTVSFPPPYIV